MKSLITVLILCVLSLSAPALRAAEAKTSCFLDIGFDAALKKAAAEKKLVLIDFYTTWCGPCKRLDRITWGNPKVQAVLGDLTVPLKIDAEKNVALAKRFAIDAYPTVVILNSDGTLRDKYVGFVPPVGFLAEFSETLAGKSNLPRLAAEKAAAKKLDDEVTSRFRRAVALQAKGANQEALAEYLWCYDDGMAKDPAYTGVRDSFLLLRLQILGKTYPPAHQALVVRRDQALALITTSPRNLSAWGDYAALNNVLGENAKSLAKFDAIPKGDIRRRELGLYLYGDLVKRKSYADALEAWPDGAFDQVLAAGTAEASSPMAKGNAEIKAQIWRGVAGRVAERIVVLAGVGRKGDAINLAGRLLSLDASPETKQTLLTALRGIGVDQLPAVGVAKSAAHG